MGLLEVMVLLQGVEESYQLEEDSHYFYRIFASNSVGIVGTDEVDISMSYTVLYLFTYLHSPDSGSRTGSRTSSGEIEGVQGSVPPPYCRVLIGSTVNCVVDLSCFMLERHILLLHAFSLSTA